MITNIIATPNILANILFNGLEVVFVVLPLALLIGKVLMDAYGRRSPYKMKIFVFAIWPLLFILAGIIFLRISQMLQ